MPLRHSVERVREANKLVFERKGFDEYEKNPSIFEPSRQDEIGKILKRVSIRKAGPMLDVGCGTGNVLRLARPYFSACYGVDLSRALLAELNRRYPGFGLTAAAAGMAPFQANVFSLVSFYGVIHHLVDPVPALKDAHRVLLPGGTLYIDHDPNYFFGRFFHLYYRLSTLRRPGFGDEETEMSEWHHTRTGGINPESLSDQLRRIGFSAVDVRYRLTSNPSLSPAFRMVRALMRSALKVVSVKSLYTHFCILAQKS